MAGAVRLKCSSASRLLLYANIIPTSPMYKINGSRSSFNLRTDLPAAEQAVRTLVLDREDSERPR